MRRAARTDNNHKEIVGAFEKLGAVVLQTYQLKKCFDILVFFKGRCLPVEIKRGKGKLTEGELEFKEKIESRGVKYNIVRTINDVQDLLYPDLSEEVSNNNTLLEILNLEGVDNILNKKK